MAILMNSSFCLFTISLLRNGRIKYYGFYCKVVQWYSMRCVCIAGYFLNFSFNGLHLYLARLSLLSKCPNHLIFFLPICTGVLYFPIFSSTLIFTSSSTGVDHTVNTWCNAPATVFCTVLSKARMRFYKSSLKPSLFLGISKMEAMTA